MTINLDNYGIVNVKYNPESAIALVGGGIDGFLALCSALKRWPTIKKVHLLFFNYGQYSYDAEKRMVQKQSSYITSQFFNLKTNIIELEDPLTPHLYKHPLSVVQIDYIHELSPKEIENLDTYIPNRNARFLVQAFGLAEIINADLITFGGVGNLNIDNSLIFVKKALELNEYSGPGKVGVYAPFVMYSKTIVAHYAQEQNLVNVVGEITTSCYFPTVTDKKVYQCGNCRSCKTLQQGFKFAGVSDPFHYKVY